MARDELCPACINTLHAFDRLFLQESYQERRLVFVNPQCSLSLPIVVYGSHVNNLNAKDPPLKATFSETT